MTDTKVEVKLFHRERVMEMVDRLEGIEEDEQTPFDLMFMALVAAEVVGIEPQSIYETIPQQYKLVQNFLGLDIET